MALLASCGGGGDGGDGGTTPPPPPPQTTLGSITASPATVPALDVGSTVTISAQAFDTQGAVIAGASGYAFSSSSTAIATVSSSGVVQGVAAGSATITVSLTLAGVTRSTTVAVTVVAPAPTLGSILATPTILSSMPTGSTRQLTMQAFDTQGAPMAGVTGYVFLSANQSVATVSSTGVVQAVAVGSTVIAISLNLGGSIATTSVAVSVIASQQILGSIVATPASIPNLAVGGTQVITMQARDTQGGVIAGATGFLFASSNEAIATVSAQGLVTGVAAGTASIGISLTIGTISAVADVNVTVAVPIPLVAQVQATTTNLFTPASVDIAAGGSVAWNFGAVTHNVTFAAGTAGAPANIGDTANSRVSRVFNTVGTFTYTCTLHAGMTGTVVVR